MEGKKISFGFSKIQKKPDLLSSSQKPENKVDLIKCLEGQSIKLVEEKPVVKEELLVIPLKEATRTAAAFASLKARHNVLNDVSEQQESTNNCEVTSKSEIRENETIEQRAARELLQTVNKNENNDTDEQSAITIPKPDELPLEGAKESSINDYENIPISKFGFAMLRGMGWKDEVKSKDNKKDLLEPIVRPKGMGLGADKIARPKPALIPPDANETLEIKKNAFVRILAGKHKDLYAQIEGFDDHAGRVIVKLALGGNYESLNEFMVQPVSKKEYAQYSKVINSAKYEEYNKLENAQGQIILKQPKPENAIIKSEDRKPIVKEEKNIPGSKSSGQNSSNFKYEDDTDERQSDNRRHESNRKQKDSYEERRRSRSRSTSSRSSDYNRKASKKKSKSKKHKNRSHGRHRYKYSSSDDEKRHKKKTKKSKRPRSRSGDRRT